MTFASLRRFKRAHAAVLQAVGAAAVPANLAERQAADPLMKFTTQSWHSILGDRGFFF